MIDDESISLADALQLLAFMGDLSMGQPIDHSKRVARLACGMAETLGLSAELCQDVWHVALLRWVGCSANANDVAAVISDDVHGRAAMLALRLKGIELLIAPDRVASRSAQISAIHCEVSVMIADALGLRPTVVDALACQFERWDGSGLPAGLIGDDIPMPVLLVLLAGDIEIFSREYGIPVAMQLLAQRANAVYPGRLVELVQDKTKDLLSKLDTQTEYPVLSGDTVNAAPVSLSMVADAIDLKLPWLTGHSRAVSRLADAVAEKLSLPLSERMHVRRAALLHGLGRVSVPNAIWNRAGPLSIADWEQARLSPYWTSRAVSQISSLEREADLASTVYERLDGSGYFRAARAATTPISHRLLPVVASFLAMIAERPWRSAITDAVAIDLLQRQAKLGRFDQSVVNALDSTADGSASINDSPTGPNILSARELEVLRLIAVGASNKVAARKLGISPATVRTHVESVFRKLACHSRAAATLRASMLGLL